MSPGPMSHDVIFFASAAELRDWFDANHTTAADLWIGYHKKGSGVPSVTWTEAVDEALCVGWIDGIARGVDETTYVQRFTPRRKGSNWSAVNVIKVEALTAERRMRPAGVAAWEARTPEKTAVYSYEREAAAFDEEEVARFRADADAWADWEARPASYRKAVTHWVTSAKQAATRARRFEALIEDSAAGRNVKPMRFGDER